MQIVQGLDGTTRRLTPPTCHVRRMQLLSGLGLKDLGFNLKVWGFVRVYG